MATGRNCSSQSVVSWPPSPAPLLFRLFLLTHFWVSLSAADDAAFCATVVRTLSACPQVPTVPSVDLSQYAGRWYAIGSNAEFALSYFGGQGGQCGSPNYTALGLVNGQTTVRVVNRGVVVTGTVRQAQSALISQSAFATATGVRHLCQTLVGDALGAPTASLAQQMHQAFQRLSALGTPINGAQRDVRGRDAASRTFSESLQNTLHTLQSLSRSTTANRDQLTEASLGAPLSTRSLTTAILNLTAASPSLHPKTKAAVTREARKILSAVRAISATSKGVFDALGNAQIQNGALTGGTLPIPLDLPKTKGLIEGQAGRVLQLAGNITESRELIEASALRVQSLAGTVAPKVAATAYAIASLASSTGPLALSTSGISGGGRGILYTTQLVEEEALQPHVIEALGTAVQNSSQPGALYVTFSQGGGPYNIVSLEGDEAEGYSTALVFSCVSTLTTGYLPQNSFFLISRSPSVPQATIDSALAFAAEKGILLAGDNIFITVSQDPDLCKPVYPQAS